MAQATRPRTPGAGTALWRWCAALALVLGGLLLPVFGRAAAAATAVANGDFETGTLAGWTQSQSGSTTWYAYTGTAAPGPTAFTIPAPPQGTYAAVTNQGGPGLAILYQDIALPAAPRYTLGLTAYYNNRGGALYSPATLAYTSADANQQYRIDIMDPAAPLDSVAPADVLATVFRTQPGDPNTLAPTPLTADLAPFAGRTVRLRLAESDNQGNFQAGVDAVALAPQALATPSLVAIAPAATPTVAPGAPDLTLTVTGGNFAADGFSVVTLNGTALVTAYVSPTQLTAQVPSALRATAGQYPVTVTNGPPGGGTSNPLLLTVAAPAQASVAPASLPFAGQQVGTASDSEQVTVTNSGGSALAVTGVTIGGANPGDFAITFNTCVGNVPASGSCVVGVRFTPAAQGDRAATLQVADSAAGSPQTVALTGTGTTPPASPAPQSVVTASAQGQGSVTPAGSTSYTTGSAATYAATAAAGQTFTGWTLDGQYVGYASSLTFTVSANRTLVATFVATPTFSDLGALSDADRQAITFLAARGIVNPAGMNGSGQFQPGAFVKRAEVAAFLARVFGWEAEFHANPFPDKCDPAGTQGCVDDRLWNDVAALRDYGVVGGYTDTTTCQSVGTTAPCYLPRDNVFKVQVVSVVARAFTKAPDLRPTGFWDRLAANPGQYTNVPDAGSQRSDLATYRQNAGAIPGQASDSQFPAPTDPATRLFVIQVLYQAYNAQFGTDHVP